MKKMKRLAALFLAVVMIMAMGMTAMAADGGKIIIDNPQEGETYTAYKIFTATTGNGHTAYRLDNESAAYTELKELADTTNTYGVEITSTTVDGVYNVEVTDAPKFAKYLKGLTLTGGIDGVLVDGKVEINTTANGYYFVNTTVGTLANLNSVEAGDITIYDKNEEPTIKKTTTVVGNSVEVGEVVDYTISGNAPSVVGYETYNYDVSDTMNAGLDFNENSLTVTVGTTVLCQNGVKTEAGTALGTDFTVTPSDNGFGIHLNLVEKNTVDGVDEYSARYPVGTEIVIGYNATVLPAAVTTVSTNDPLKNEATLNYSNDPDSNTNGTTGSEVELKSANIVIDKYVGNKDDENDRSGAKLAGAKFVLKNSEGKYYNYTDSKVTWVDSLESATEVTTDANGAATFLGLKDGTYTLIETEAPAGYNLMESGKEVQITHDGTTVDIVVGTGTVANLAGAVLPSTGGIGTTIFYVVGGIMVLGAGVLLITKKRMSAK